MSMEDVDQKLLGSSYVYLHSVDSCSGCMKCCLLKMNSLNLYTYMALPYEAQQLLCYLTDVPLPDGLTIKKNVEAFRKRYPIKGPSPILLDIDLTFEKTVNKSQIFCNIHDDHSTRNIIYRAAREVYCCWQIVHLNKPYTSHQETAAMKRYPVPNNFVSVVRYVLDLCEPHVPCPYVTHTSTVREKVCDILMYAPKRICVNPAGHMVVKHRLDKASNALEIACKTLPQCHPWREAV